MFLLVVNIKIRMIVRNFLFFASDKMSFSYLPTDILRYLPDIANMDIADILNLCQADRRTNEVLCNNKKFWVDLVADRYNVDVSNYSMGHIRKYLQILEKAFQYLSDDPGVIFNTPPSVLAEAIRLFESDYNRLIARIKYDHAGVGGKVFDDLIRHHFDKAVLLILTDPNIKSTRLNTLLTSSSILDNVPLLEEILQSRETKSTIDPAVLNYIMKSAEKHRKPEVIRVLLDNPLDGMRWIPPEVTRGGWVLVY